MEEKFDQEKEEKSMLLRLCKEFGISVSPNSKLETLESAISDYLHNIKAENKKIKNNNYAKQTNENTLTNIDKIKEPLRLIYCKINCNNPDKQNIDGELFTVANKNHIISKVVFFKTNTFVPKMLLSSIEEKFYSRGEVVRDKNGKESIKIKTFPEYTVEYLEIPDKDYFEALKQKQLAVQTQTNYEDSTLRL